MRALLPVLAAFALAASQPRALRVGTGYGGVVISTTSDTVTVNTVIQNLRQRIDSLALVVAQSQQCAQLIVPIVVEIRALLWLLPQELSNLPVCIEAATPMDDEHFGSFLLLLENEPFSDERLALLRQVAAKNYFTCQQLGYILDRFEFESDKLEAVRILRRRIVDPEHAFIVCDKFEFESDKKKFLEIMLR